MLIRAVIVFACLIVASGAIARAERTEPVPVRQSFATFPMSLGGWTGVQQPALTDDVLAVLGVDDYLTRIYYAPDRASGVGLYVGYYESQRRGDTIHSPQNCLPGSGWEAVSNSTLRLRIAPDVPGSEVGINRYIVQKGLSRQLVLYWYQSHGRVVANEYMSKITLMVDAFRLNRTDAALVRVITPIGTGPEGEARAEAVAVGFVRELFPVLGTYLPT
jgi:EpsI family protein